VPLGEALERLPFLRELLAANRGSSGWRSGPATSASAASSASPADAVGRLAANLVHLEVRPAVARYVSAGDAGAKT
jgi:hypothetical protein